MLNFIIGMFCIAAFIIFSILGIFSARYRELAVLSWKCVFRRLTFKPCDADAASKIKMHFLGKIIQKNPGIAAFLNKRFEILSWLFIIIFFASAFFTAKSALNLIKFGTCNPENPAACVVGETPNSETECPPPTTTPPFSD